MPCEPISIITLTLGSVNKKHNIRVGESPYRGVAVHPIKYVFSLKREELELDDTYWEPFCTSAFPSASSADGLNK